ncbi:hypothetical protein GCM10011533_23140 [Streptosporangium jomthongense]|nr:hypothetical protein GCM10011533_23140 [Streptosporangium jomthongense]
MVNTKSWVRICPGMSYAVGNKAKFIEMPKDYSIPVVNKADPFAGGTILSPG